MNVKRRYCGIERMPSVTFESTPATYGESKDGSLLGDRILEAALYGADLGTVVPVSFDEDVADDSTAHDVDILASPNHDFFDIAESVGHMVEAQAPPQPGDDDNE